MEISIDLKLMKEIVFKDDLLLKEMLTEWIDDSNTKMMDIKARNLDNNISGVFNKIHELKTNFSMIHCYQGIQLCEKYIREIESKEKCPVSDFSDMDNLVDSVNTQIKKIIQNII